MSLQYETHYKSTAAVWILASNGQVPTNAVIGGYDADGTTLYVGRFVTKQGQLAPGKVCTSHGCAYSSCAGVEQSSKTYQVLTHPNQTEQLKWVPTTGGNLPTGALRAGGGSGKDGLYIARAPFHGGVCCGKFEPGHGWPICLGEVENMQ
ncbi:unnamed protein product [Rotaria magnacalcarata]|uniref:Uncharacterized protein n=1 Tax=Rotaria magnacalcarata TaxID=392030 RepID=A0A816BRR4_9BILA|nr:unnamed protein product [Rotaria magnacalcarata]CAF4009679.1 unnamed protein product [Rotaria magnacalcarata]